MSLVELFIRNDIHFPFGCLFSLCDKLTQSSNLAALEKLTTLLSPADGKRCFLHSRIWGVKVQRSAVCLLQLHLLRLTIANVFQFEWRRASSSPAKQLGKRIASRKLQINAGKAARPT